MNILKPILLISMLLITSCSPQSKGAYLSAYKGFILKVDKEHESYSDKDWKSVDSEFNKFTGKLYTKFEKQLTWQEEILIKKYQVQYNLYKLSSGSKESFDIENNENYQKKKKELEYYYENNMQDDIDSFMKQAKEAGDSTLVIVNRIMEQLNKEYKAKDN